MAFLQTSGPLPLMLLLLVEDLITVVFFPCVRCKCCDVVGPRESAPPSSTSGRAGLLNLPDPYFKTHMFFLGDALGFKGLEESAFLVSEKAVGVTFIDRIPTGDIFGIF